MVKVGDTYRFTPSAYSSGDNGTAASKQKTEESVVEGTVIQVKHDRRWFRVEYTTKYYGKGHECIKF